LSKIIGTMLVKNEEGKMLESVLKQMQFLCDTLIVADDGSTDNTPKICADYGAIVYSFKESMWGINERVRRQFLWEKATEVAENGDWIMYLDADETIDNYEYLPQFLSNIEESNLDGIGLTKFDMWSLTQYRDDDLWCVHNTIWLALVRYDKNKEYIWRDKTLHVGSFPLNAATRIALIGGINIQHWGWANESERQRKYDQYMAADPEGKEGNLAQYRSILDPNPSLRTYGLKINSPEWWDEEFTYQWTFGPEQTTYFMDQIIRYSGVNFENKTVLDYGCAQGHGVDLLTKLISPPNEVEGFDISSVCIKQARKLFPNLTFYDELPIKTYNIVICSNVLEHFVDDEIFNRLFDYATEYVIIMTPYNQLTSNIHPRSINENTFPIEHKGFKLIKCGIVPDEKPELQGGTQILFVYQKEK